MQDAINFAKERTRLEQYYEEQRKTIKSKNDSLLAEVQTSIVETRAKLNQDCASVIDKQKAEKLRSRIHEKNLEKLSLQFQCKHLVLEQTYLEKHAVLKLKLTAGMISDDIHEARTQELEDDEENELEELDVDEEKEREELEVDEENEREEREELELYEDMAELRQQLDVGDITPAEREQKQFLLKALESIHPRDGEVQNLTWQPRIQVLAAKQFKDGVTAAHTGYTAGIDTLVTHTRNLRVQSNNASKAAVEHVHEVSAKRNPYREIIEFIASLREMELDEKAVVFSLPKDVYLGGQIYLDFLNGELYIRECYRKLRDIIFCEVAVNKTKSFVVQGNPGIGKSLFSYFMIYTLMKKGKTIIWEPRSTGNAGVRICIAGSDPPRVVNEHSGFYEELADKSCWYIVDGHEPEPVNAYTLLVCLPDEKRWRHIKNSGAVMLYMPVWTWSEFETAHGLGLARSRPKEVYPNQHREEDNPALTLKEVEELFVQWGGIPRYVFERGHDKAGLEDEMTEAIHSADLKELKRHVGVIENPKDVTYRLLHMDAETKQFGQDGTKLRPFRTYRIVFASNYVGSQVTKHLIANSRAELMAFLLSRYGTALTAALRGLMFENIANQFLSDGGTFRVRKLQPMAVKDDAASQQDPPPVTEKIHFDKSAMKAFKEPSDVTSVSGLYWKPTANSLMLPDSLFQMTVSKDHPIQANGLENAVKRLYALQAAKPPVLQPNLVANAQRVVRLYFVVPHSLFEQFPTQDYTTKKNDTISNIPAVVDCVEQYALEVRLTAPHCSPCAPKSPSEQSSKA